jgi:hypothetical protein
MWETVVVIIIAASAGFLAARSFYRSLSGKSKGCVGGCGACQCKKDPYRGA